MATENTKELDAGPALIDRIIALEAKLNPHPAIATTLWDREVDERLATLEAALAKQQAVNKATRRKSSPALKLGIRWKVFRLWCDIGGMICPQEYRGLASAVYGTIRMARWYQTEEYLSDDDAALAEKETK